MRRTKTDKTISHMCNLDIIFPCGKNVAAEFPFPQTNLNWFLPNLRLFRPLSGNLFSVKDSVYNLLRRRYNG